MIIMKEEWKQIPGFTCYNISNFGNIISYKTGVPTELKQSICSKYKMVTLTEGGNRQTVHVHKLVAITFLGYQPDGYTQTINHKDENKLNNRLDNLEIISHRDNTNLGQAKRKTGSKHRGITVIKSRKGDRYYRAVIQYKGESHYLGTHKDELLAAELYQKALQIVLNESHRILPGTKIRDLL